MATMVIVVTGCEVKKGKGDYFVMVQLDQNSNTEATILPEKITIKKKTDVSINSQFPNFSVNALLFEDVVIFSDLSLKIGLFELVKGDVFIFPNLHVKKKTPVLLGTNKMQINPKMVAQLSKGEALKEAMRMVALGI